MIPRPPSRRSNDNDRSNAKGDLNNLAMKLLKRPVADGDVVYCSQLLEVCGGRLFGCRLLYFVFRAMRFQTVISSLSEVR